MKQLIPSAFFFLSIVSGALAEPYYVERILKDATTMTLIELNSQTVFCTARGYGNVQLKVSVPELDELAHFDHRVLGEGLPCMTGGACSEVLQPGALIRPNERFALAPIRVILKESLKIDYDAKTCERLVSEDVKSVIRDHRFEHHKYSEWKSADYEKCLASDGL